MRNSALGDVLKVWLYAIASVFLGAWMAPLLYNMGKALAEVSSVKQTNGPLQWLANQCREADFPQFFMISLWCAAGLLALPCVEWLRAERSHVRLRNPWQIRLPVGTGAGNDGQALVKNPEAARHVLRGFGVVVGLFLLIMGILLLGGFSQWKQAGEGIVPAIAGILIFSIGFGVVQEILFRGLVFGVFLRAMRPPMAIGLSALLFALMHFLKPAAGLNVADPDASKVGFEMLGLLVSAFSEVKVLLGTFAPLLALGGVLAFARWRTASLWLPIGLHVGWIFITGIADQFTVNTGHLDMPLEFLFGRTLQQGAIAMFGLIVAGCLIDHLTTRRTDDPEISSNP